MRKIFIIIVAIAVIIILVVGGLGIYRFNFTQGEVELQQTGRLNSLTGAPNGTYLINGQQVTLVNGKANQASAPGSASRTVTSYFGNAATGDLNGDGLIDAAFLLTQDTGGSGLFYYVAVSLATTSPAKIQGTNAVYLEDRISPQSTEIVDGKVIVNFMDHGKDDAMAGTPTVATTKYFSVSGTELKEIIQTK